MLDVNTGGLSSNSDQDLFATLSDGPTRPSSNTPAGLRPDPTRDGIPANIRSCRESLATAVRHFAGISRESALASAGSAPPVTPTQARLRSRQGRRPRTGLRARGQLAVAADWSFSRSCLLTLPLQEQRLTSRRSAPPHRLLRSTTAESRSTRTSSPNMWSCASRMYTLRWFSTRRQTNQGNFWGHRGEPVRAGWRQVP